MSPRCLAQEMQAYSFRAEVKTRRLSIPGIFLSTLNPLVTGTAFMRGTRLPQKMHSTGLLLPPGLYLPHFLPLFPLRFPIFITVPSMFPNHH